MRFTLLRSKLLLMAVLVLALAGTASAQSGYLAFIEASAHFQTPGVDTLFDSNFTNTDTFAFTWGDADAFAEATASAGTDWLEGASAVLGGANPTLPPGSVAASLAWTASGINYYNHGDAFTAQLALDYEALVAAGAARAGLDFAGAGVYYDLCFGDTLLYKSLQGSLVSGSGFFASNGGIMLFDVTIPAHSAFAISLRTAAGGFAYSVKPVPEPSSLLILASFSGVAFLRRRKLRA